MMPYDRQQNMQLFSTNSFWRVWRYRICTLILCLSILLIAVGCFLSTPMQPAAKSDPYMDDVPVELYKKVLGKWYDINKGENRFNSRNVSIWNPSFLSEVRTDWLLYQYKHNQSYNLYKPDVTNPSMGQAQRVLEILNNKTNGFFVECGAYDGETRSNTLVLERFFNWTGILVEADPINFTKMLQKNRRAYLSPTCMSITSYPMIIIALEVSAVRMFQASFLMARNIGRIHEPGNSKEELPENTLDVAYHGTHIKVQCLPFAAYLAALNVTTVDYFSLDIEGNEIDVLETIPFHRFNIKILSVEYIHNEKSRQYMIDFMKKHGYYVDSLVEHPDNLANDIIFVKDDLF